MAFPTGAVPYPSSLAIQDEMEVDQSNWKDGIILTRMPDPALKARSWELQYETQPKGFELSVAGHYRDHAANKSFAWVPPYALPPGTTFEQVAYRDQLAVRIENNATESARLTLERAFAHD